MDFPIHLTSQLREHLRSLRKGRDLTQAELGRLLGVGQARIAEIEGNPGAVSVDQLLRVVSALQASLVLRDGLSDRPPAARPPAATELRDGDAASDAAPASGHDFVVPSKKGSW